MNDMSTDIFITVSEFSTVPMAVGYLTVPELEAIFERLGIDSVLEKEFARAYCHAVIGAKKYSEASERLSSSRNMIEELLNNYAAQVGSSVEELRKALSSSRGNGLHIGKLLQFESGLAELQVELDETRSLLDIEINWFLGFIKNEGGLTWHPKSWKEEFVRQMKGYPSFQDKMRVIDTIENYFACA